MAEVLPSPSARILDIGGGPGRYAIELTRQGYEVTLVDLSDECLRLCAQKAAEQGAEPAAMIQGDARDLSTFGDAALDAVLLFGPLCHLLSARDRTDAITEAVRVSDHQCECTGPAAPDTTTPFLCRISVWLPPERVPEAAAVFDILLPALDSIGMRPSAQASRPTVDSVAARLYEFVGEPFGLLDNYWGR